jgi:two-component system, OmpR family, phosphate regulon response regulator PhoB
MVQSRQELIEAAWPRRVHVEPRTVDVHIGRLRRQLNKGGEANLIRTVRSIGYSLDPSS